MKRLTQGMGQYKELRLPEGPDLCQGPGSNDPHEQAGRLWGPGAILRCQLPVGKKVGTGVHFTFSVPARGLDVISGLMEGSLQGRQTQIHATVQ